MKGETYFNPGLSKSSESVNEERYEEDYRVRVERALKIIATEPGFDGDLALLKKVDELVGQPDFRSKVISMWRQTERKNLSAAEAIEKEELLVKGLVIRIKEAIFRQ